MRIHSSPVQKPTRKQHRFSPYKIRASLSWIAIFAIGGLLITLFAHAQNVYTVPASIAADCSREVSSELNAWFKTVPDGSVLQFATNGCYTIEGSLAIQNRNGLTIQGQNATFKSNTDGSTAPQIEGHVDKLWPRQRAHWFIKNSTNIVLNGLTIDGPNSAAGPTNDAYKSEFEEQHGVMIYGSTNVAVENSTMQEPYGDFVSVFGGSKQVRIQGNTLDKTGRQGISIVNGSNVLIQNNTIKNVGRSMIDVEPAVASWQVKDVVIRNNTFGPANGVFLASLGAGPNVQNIIINHNTLLGIRLYAVVQTNDKTGQGLRKQGFQITHNISDTVTGTTIAPIRFEDVNDITITNNYQKVAGRLLDNGEVIYSGVSVWLERNNNVLIRDNVFPVYITGTKNNNQTTLTHAVDVLGLTTCNNILSISEKPPAIDGSCPVDTPAIVNNGTRSNSSGGKMPTTKSVQNVPAASTPALTTTTGMGSAYLTPNQLSETVSSSKQQPFSRVTWRWQIIVLIVVGLSGIGGLIHWRMHRRYSQSTASIDTNNQAVIGIM